MKLRRLFSILFVVVFSLAMILNSYAMEVHADTETKTIYSWESQYDENAEMRLYNPVEESYVVGSFKEIQAIHESIYTSLGEHIIEAFDIKEGIWEVVIDESGELYPQDEAFLYNRTIGCYRSSVMRLNEDGIIVPVDLVEFAEFLNGRIFEAEQYLSDFGYICNTNSRSAESISPAPTRAIVYGYSQTSTSYETQVSVHSVSSTYIGPCYITAISSANIYEAYSPSGNAAILSAIKAGSSITWTGTILSAPNAGSFWVPSGKTGRVYFYPDASRTAGTLTTLDTATGYYTTTSAMGMSPVKNGSYAVGLFFCDVY